MPIYTNLKECMNRLNFPDIWAFAFHFITYIVCQFSESSVFHVFLQHFYMLVDLKLCYQDFTDMGRILHGLILIKRQTCMLF